MNIIKSFLDGVLEIRQGKFTDARGSFNEVYRLNEFQEAGILAEEGKDFVQANQSKSKRGVLRGMHYQGPPRPQGKFVSVPYGRILDVVADIRKSSPTYGNYLSWEISSDSTESLLLWIPSGFLHGFLSLKDGTIVQYYCTHNTWDRESEGGIRWDDTDLAIDWKLRENGLTQQDLIISNKDKALKTLREIINPFDYSKGHK